MKYIRKTVLCAVFLVIFAMLFSVSDRILSRKSVEGWWNVTAKIDGFYNSPKNEYEVIYFGSSNTYCSFNPLTVWEKTGVKSYVFATQQQPVWATYHYMIDAFDRQKPKVAVMDVLMLSKNENYYDDGVNYTFCDNMPLSVNKIKLASVSAEKGDRFGLICRFVKYHSRWSELTQEDFEYRKSAMRDYSKGFYVLEQRFDNAVHTDTSAENGKIKLTEKNEKYLRKIIDLTRDKGVELILVKTPSNNSVEEKKYYNSVKEIAEENNVKFVDYNLCYDEIGLDVKTDFYDATHLNVWGADKFTKYFVENTEFFEGRQRTDDDWLGDYEKYIDEISEN